MRNGITKNAQSNRRVDVVRDLTPLLKISERISLGSLDVFHTGFLRILLLRETRATHRRGLKVVDLVLRR